MLEDRAISALGCARTVPDMTVQDVFEMAAGWWGLVTNFLVLLSLPSGG
jgi:hypothetical protein